MLSKFFAILAALAELFIAYNDRRIEAKARAKLLEEQKNIDEEQIDYANNVRADPDKLPDDLLLPPANRKTAKLRIVQTDLRQRYGGSDEHPEVSGGSD